VQSCRTTSGQKFEAENLSAITTAPPAASMLHGATMPPTE
jgi:hypothetical protein